MRYVASVCYIIAAMMRFNERKATQAAAYLLKKRGGQMSYLKLKADPGVDELSEAEIAVLEEVWEALGRKGRWELVELAHKLPEWKDPQGSALLISYRDILAAQGISDEEIGAIEEEICGVAATQDLVGAR